MAIAIHTPSLAVYARVAASYMTSIRSLRMLIARNLADYKDIAVVLASNRTRF